MPHFFEKRDPWGHGLGLWVLVGMAFALPLAIWGVTHLRMQNDVEHWLADDNIETRQFDWYNQHFATADSLLLTWDDSAIEDPRVEQLAARISGTVDADGVRRGGLKQVATVHTPGQLIRKMVDQKIDREEAIRRVTGVLIGPGRVWCQLSSAGLDQRQRSMRLLRDEAAARFGLKIQIIDPSAKLMADAGFEEEEAEAAEEVAAEAMAETKATDSASEIVTEEAPAHDFQISWSHMHADPKLIAEFVTWAKTIKIPVAGQRDGEPLLSECFLHAGQPAALAIDLSAAGKADRRGTLQQLRLIAEAAGIPANTLHMSGSLVTSMALSNELAKAWWNPVASWYLPHQRSAFVCAWAVGAFLTFWLLRNARLAIIALTISYLTTSLTLALLPAFGASLNTVLTVMPMLLLAVTLSGAVNIANSWKNEALRDPQTAIIHSIAAARTPCLTVALTIAVGLGSLMTSHMAAVREFGFYAAIGTLISVVGVLYGVPALLQAWPVRPAPVTVVVRRPWTRLGRMIVQHSTAITIAWILASAVAIYGLRNIRTETKLISYFPNNSQLVQDYHYLEETLAGTVPLETVISFGRAAREELNFTQRTEIVRAIANKMRALPHVSGALSLADFQPVGELPPENPSMRDKLAFNTRAKEIESRIRKDSQVRDLYQVATTPTEFNDAGDELWRISSRVTVMSRFNYAELTEKLEAICRSEMKYHAETRHLVTGMVPLFLATQQAITESLLYSGMMAFGLIVLVMMIVVRDFWAGLLSMLPNAIPLCLVFGVMGWRDIPVDVGTLIGASVALGITVDGTLRLARWYREGIVAGLSHRRAIVKALEHSGPALWQTHVAMGLSMLILTPAPLLLISRFGGLMGSLIFTAMLADIVLIPAMLAGPMGYFIYVSAQQQRNRLKAVIEDPDPEGMIRHTAHVLPAKPQIAAESRPDGSQFEPREARQRKRRRS